MQCKCNMPPVSPIRSSGDRNTFCSPIRASTSPGSRLNIDDFYKVFKTRKGRDLRLTIYGGLMFRSIANADEEMKRVTEKAEAALRKIGCESPINARRIRKYGIEIESPGGIPTTKT